MPLSPLAGFDEHNKPDVHLRVCDPPLGNGYKEENVETPSDVWPAFGRFVRLTTIWFGQ